MGYTAYMLFEPESKLGVVLLRNYNIGETNLGGAAGELLSELIQAVSDGGEGRTGSGEWAAGKQDRLQVRARSHR